jgi:hypothetical protein
MAPIYFTSRSPVGQCVDAQIAGTVSELPDDERERVTRDLRAIASVYDAAAAAAKDAAASKELTPLGQREAIKRAITAAVGQLTTHDATVATLRETAAATRAKALEVPSERTPEALMLEREVRDRVANLDPLQVRVKYLTAVEQGDWLTVRALEAAPSSFSQLTPALREQGSAAKLLRSPLAPQVAAADASSYVYATTAATAKTELRKLAERHGCRMPSEPT